MIPFYIFLISVCTLYNTTSSFTELNMITHPPLPANHYEFATPWHHSVSDLKKVKNVVIVCPSCITGGIENLCQIAHALKNMHNVEASFLWITYSDNACKYQENNLWYLRRQDYDLTPDLYKPLYNPSYLNKDVPLDSTTLIILPEIWCDFLPFFEDAQKMISWLSIGNIHGAQRSESCRILIERKELYRLPCFHLAQAPWIQKWLTIWGAPSVFMGDYISTIFTTPSNIQKIPNSIAYYPAKGKDLAHKFIDQHPEYVYIKLENMSKEQVVAALDYTQIYIDFGHFPGMDRTPREAAVRNCIVLLHNAGCAVDFDSYPIADFFRFTSIDVDNNVLHQKIETILQNYTFVFTQQAYWRLHIAQEHYAFQQRINDLFNNQ